MLKVQSHYLLLPLLAIAVVGKLANRVHCPDGQSFCPDDTTCCQLSDEGHYGCCPLPKAICCSDHLHCCPESSQCDLQHQTCLQADGRSQPFYRKIPASSSTHNERPPIEQKQLKEEVICPDKSSKCPPQTTCCPLNAAAFGRHRKDFWRHQFTSHQSVRYGCCPTVQAVCCKDHLHCCPRGTRCDSEEGKCLGGERTEQEQPFGIVPMRKVPATKLTHLKSAPETEPSVHFCGDGVGLKGGHRRASACGRNEKCCRHRDEEDKKTTGCCPFVDGQCCVHSAHCCPIGFACAREEGRCVSEQNGISLSTLMFPTGPAAKRRFHGLKPPTECPDGTFCASPTDICCPRTLAGVEGEETTIFDCCPLNGGICCKGIGKCCPMGYKCSGEGCERMNVREQIIHLFLDKN
uniref:Granulins domain-containing protein n=1 Tax=Globodera rostochiensis TaxID=31243 RepID=A0A914GU84_GLORO